MFGLQSNRNEEFSNSHVAHVRCNESSRAIQHDEIPKHVTFIVLPVDNVIVRKTKSIAHCANKCALYASSLSVMY